MVSSAENRLPGRSRTCRREQRRRRDGLSVVYVVLFMLVLFAFVSLAVDIGRARVARIQLQATSDAAARAAATALPNAPNSIDAAQQRALEVAQLNTVIDVATGPDSRGGRKDSPAVLDVEEDIEFGMWMRSTRDFVLIEDSSFSVTDERRLANAVRVWGRRAQTYTVTDEDGTSRTVERNTGLPLIFGPVIDIHHANIQTRAISMIRGGQRSGWGFVGLDSVRINGTPTFDSYAAATETYPGDGGFNRLGSIASNGDITLNGNVTVHGDLRPGVEKNILPFPLDSGVRVDGIMYPLDQPLTEPTPTFTPPPTNDNALVIPQNAVSDGTMTVNGNQTVQMPSVPLGVDYVFTSWTTRNGTVFIRNDLGPVNVYVNGNFTMNNKSAVEITSSAFPVTFWINGNYNQHGRGIVNTRKIPATLTIHVTRVGTVNLGGTADMYAHIDAPLSAVSTLGDAHFFGWIVGKTLTVSGNVGLHYDQMREPDAIREPHRVEIVK